MTVLSGSEWRESAAEHAERVDTELADILARRDSGTAHPVDDFLFHYYSVRPAQLRVWHPGMGVDLMDAPEYADRRFYRVRENRAVLDVPAFLAQRGPTVDTAHTLLTAALGQTPRFGCFGMHEWAMVLGLAQEQTRHPYLPLRFPPEEVSRIVEEVGCRCSHIDAFRFFTPAAKPLNLVQPTRERQAEFDQPGCLHVNMDLYKWAGKLSPAVSSELLFDTFVLARDIRVVDMQASAYDLTEWGLDPVRVETPEGRAEYADVQKGFAERAQPLRRELVAVTQELITIRQLVRS
ncbi:3-methyladenine DNA glycosylase [Tessaracoccus antarcticus]|uniref:3-methyladenine DNA glycosylase n=1 Tax=Tessaracoccus antarcticus TaxID=2479848 RepID=UPI0018F58316|nr:3-methyladenine DNA glycosylase [Tessaracoccus antarcticus]